jgi:hypothetical protein
MAAGSSKIQPYSKVHTEGRRVAKAAISGAVTSSYVLGLGGEQITEVNGSGQWVHSNVYAGGALLATYDNAGIHFHVSTGSGHDVFRQMLMACCRDRTSIIPSEMG